MEVDKEFENGKDSVAINPKKIVEYKAEYEQQLYELDQKGMQPVGINEHLESFKRYFEWREKTKQLFDNDDIAKDLL